MDHAEEYFEKVEEIHWKEHSSLVRYVVGKHERNKTRVRKLSPVELISYSLMSIQAEYSHANPKVLWRMVLRNICK